MKNKNILIAVGVVILIAIILFISQGKTKPSNNTNNTLFKNENTQESNGIIGSIKEAIANSMSFKCEYNIENNKTIVYVKNKSIRIEGSWQAKSNTGMIMKDNKLWTWDNEKKEGMIMPLNPSQEENQGSSSEDIINGLEAQKQFCKVALVDDSMFIPPTDVKFQDLSQFMEQLQLTGMPSAN